MRYPVAMLGFETRLHGDKSMKVLKIAAVALVLSLGVVASGCTLHPSAPHGPSIH